MADQDFNIKVVTTADTAGIRQTTAGLTQIQQMQAAAAKQAASIPASTESSSSAQAAAYQLGQSLRVVAGGALIAAGYQLVSQLRAAATEIEKISASLDKEGAQIVANAVKFGEMSKFAKENADVIKIGEGALKGVEEAHSRLLEQSARELSTWDKIKDIWTSGFDVFKRGVPRPQADALKLQQSIAAQNLELAKQNAIYDISAARIEQAKLATETYEQSVKRLTDAMKAQEALLTNDNLVRDVDGYLKAANAAESYRKELAELKSEHDKAVSETGKKIAAADPQVQAILKQEQAARVAREEGRQKDADLFEKSAEAFKRGATPQQLEQVKKAELDPNLINAIKAAFDQSMQRYWQ